jgi:hypothetical protein
MNRCRRHQRCDNLRGKLALVSTIDAMHQVCNSQTKKVPTRFAVD